MCRPANRIRLPAAAAAPGGTCAGCGRAPPARVWSASAPSRPNGREETRSRNGRTWLPPARRGTCSASPRRLRRGSRSSFRLLTLNSIHLCRQAPDDCADPHLVHSMFALSVLVHDPCYLGDGRLHHVVDDPVVVRRHARHLAHGLLHFHHRLTQPFLQRSRRFALPLAQPPDEHVGARRQDEDGDRLRRRVRPAHLNRAVHLDVHQHVPPAPEDALDLAPQGAVQLPGVRGPLERLSRGATALELLPRQEMVRPAVVLPCAGRARRRGYRIADVRPARKQRLRDRRLATSGRRGQDDDPRRHSRFSSCSRSFSSSPFIVITVWVIAASFAFEPIVFTSRKSSWARKPSRLPTAPSPASVSRHAARCVRSRTSSSVMSTRSAIRAISTASRCGSTCAPAVSSATAFLSRSRSVTRRSGARSSTARAPPRRRGPPLPGARPPPRGRAARGARRGAAPPPLARPRRQYLLRRPFH